MYQVVLINNGIETVIHHSTADEQAPHLASMNLQMFENQSNIFNFVIYKHYSGYNDIVDLATQIKIFDLQNGNIKYEGRILVATENMDSEGKFYKEVTCESELAYLNDSLVGRWELHPSTLPEDSVSYAEPNHTILTALTKIIDNHNSSVEAYKQFTIGIVEISGGVYFTTNRESSLDALIRNIISDNGVVIKIRKENGIRYLDILIDDPSISNTIIALSRNLKTFKKTPNYATFCTKLLAIGADGLTFESINNGKNYVENVEAIEQFGSIKKSFEWTYITAEDELLQKAQTKLTEVLSNTYVSVEVTALDLNCIGLTPEEFNVSTKYLIENEVQNFSEVLKVVQLDLDLLAVWNSKLTFSNKPIISSSNATDVQQQVNTNRNETLTYNGRLTQKVIGVDERLEAYKEKTDLAIGIIKTDVAEAQEDIVVLNQEVDVVGNAITNHANNINNPHKVTKAQIGLGNVDNTSDLNKPISTATQIALDVLTTGSNNYVHPVNHAPSIIAQDSTNRFVTDIEKVTWNGKAETSVATTSVNGLMSIIDKTKLDTIEANAEVNNISDINATDLTDGGDTTLHYHATDRNRTNHTGTQLASTISDFASTVRSTVLTGLTTTTNVVISATDTVLSALGKLQKQITDNLSTLTSHTGNTSNPHSTTKAQVGLGNVDNTSDTNKPISSAAQSALDSKINTSQKGVANGVAQLDANGLVPSSQLPSYVNDILEYTSNALFPATGEAGIIYLNTTTNLTYRWSGTVYAEVSPSIALGETSSTAYAGDKGKTTTDKVNAHIINTTNPHNVTKAQVGLGNVDNVNTNNQTPTYTLASTNTTLTSGEILTTAFGKIAKAISSLISHLADTVSHITSTERTNWNSASNNNHVHSNKTTLDNTTASYTTAEQTKLSGISTGANNYTLPVASTVIGGVKSGTDITVDASGNVSVNDDSHNHVIANVDGLQTALDGKVDDNQVLTNVPLNAKFTDTVYVHPTNHAPSIITQDSSNRFVTDTEKATWNGKATQATIDASINTIQIGGRNLIILSKLYSYAGYNTTPTITNAVISTVGAGTVYALTLARGGWTPENIQYTLSGIMKKNGVPVTNAMWTLKRASTYNPSLATNSFYIDDTTGKFVITETYSGSSSWIFHALVTFVVGDVITIENFKMEKGNKATDWTPAIEDMAYKTANGATRPTTNLFVGMVFFDTRLGKPIWCKTTSPVAWVDSTGRNADATPGLYIN